MQKIFINIGNTYTTLLLNSEVYKFKTLSLKSKIIEFDKNALVFISSVVSECNLLIENHFSKVYFLDSTNSNLDFSLMKNYSTIGADRLANAIACCCLYKDNCLIVDCGTYFTIELVNKKEQFLGGFILPGRHLQRVAVSDKKSLPYLQVSNLDTKKVLGKNTDEAIELGIDKGLVGSLSYLINDIKDKYDIKKLCFTGGDGIYYHNFFPEAVYIEDLTLQGLKFWSDLLLKPKKDI